MTTATTASPRDTLLAAVIASMTRHGLGARSLRDLAADAGTSHRMLIHHFGSREGLLIAIVEAIETQQREVLRDATHAGTTALEAMWQQLTDPQLRPFERLFFECYARGAQGEAPFDRLLPALVDDWLALYPRGRDRDRGRMQLALVRGLLLDLVATDDRAGVDRAMREYAALVR